VIRMYQEYGTIEESEIIEKSSGEGMTRAQGNGPVIKQNDHIKRR